jgi:hypothetical protein
MAEKRQPANSRGESAEASFDANGVECNASSMHLMVHSAGFANRENIRWTGCILAGPGKGIDGLSRVGRNGPL